MLFLVSNSMWQPQLPERTEVPRVQSVKETEGEGQQGEILAHIYLPLLLSYVLHRALAVACNAFGKDKFLPALKEASDSQ